MTCEGCDIVVVPFPFTEKNTVRHRPAVVITTEDFNNTHDHLILAMITSARNSSWASDVTIRDWQSSQLRVSCKIRLKLFALPKSLVIRKLGRLSDRDREAFCKVLGNSLTSF
jgi:mRNA interferase MazF